MLYTAAIGTIVLALPAFLLIQTKSAGLQFLGIGILGILLVILLSSISSTLPAMFPTQVRYSGFAIGAGIIGLIGIAFVREAAGRSLRGSRCLDRTTSSSSSRGTT